MNESLLENNALKKIGSQYVRSIFKYIPAQIAIERLMQNSYECPCCKKTEHPYIRKAKVPTSFMPHSLASAGSVAEVVTQKYVNSMPLYRQEEIWKNLGVDLSRDFWTEKCFMWTRLQYRFSRKTERNLKPNLICGYTGRVTTDESRSLYTTINLQGTEI